MEYFNEKQIREEICKAGQKLYDKEYVAANDGNISVKINEHQIIITPTGVSKGDLTPESLVKVGLDGTVFSKGVRPSSEVKMHLQVYKLNSEVKGVVHAHPPYATAFAVARIPLDRPILVETTVGLGVVPVSEYALTGTQEVPEVVTPYVKDYNAVLLANHGVLTWGQDLTQAFFRMETVEQYSKIMCYLKQIGSSVELNSEQVEELIKVREKFGITTGGVPKSR